MTNPEYHDRSLLWVPVFVGDAEDGRVIIYKDKDQFAIQRPDGEFRALEPGAEIEYSNTINAGEIRVAVQSKVWAGVAIGSRLLAHRVEARERREVEETTRPKLCKATVFMENDESAVLVTESPSEVAELTEQAITNDHIFVKLTSGNLSEWNDKPVYLRAKDVKFIAPPLSQNDEDDED